MVGAAPIYGVILRWVTVLDMRYRRWPRVLAWVLLGAAVFVGAATFAIAKRPTATPRYPADAWTGQVSQLTGWLTEEDQGATACWTITTGYLDDPDSRTGLVLPDSYRSFAPAIIDRGSGDPVSFISGDSIWAGPAIVTSLTEVTANVRIASDDPWRDAARDEWDRLCGHIADVNVVAVVEPGSLKPTS